MWICDTGTEMSGFGTKLFGFETGVGLGVVMEKNGLTL